MIRLMILVVTISLRADWKTNPISAQSVFIIRTSFPDHQIIVDSNLGKGKCMGVVRGLECVG